MGLAKYYVENTGVTQSESELVLWNTPQQVPEQLEEVLAAADTIPVSESKQSPELIKLEEFKEKANSQDGAGYLGLANCYEKGIGVTQNAAEAARYYRLAKWKFETTASQGDKQGQFNLANCYLKGIPGILQKDEKRAIQFYKQSADQGYADAKFELGNCYKNGIGVRKDEQEAARLYELAAQQGHGEAQISILRCYLYGEGVRLNRLKAEEWCNKAAKNECKLDWAWNLLGNYYKRGEDGEKDYKKAVECFRKAADKGLAEAQYELGVCYINRQGVNGHDITLAMFALSLFTKAAKQNHPEAQLMLGHWYEKGYIIKDEKQAFHWYKEADKHNLAEAQYNIYRCYKNGIGVEKDIPKAYNYLKKVFDQKKALLTPSDFSWMNRTYGQNIIDSALKKESVFNSRPRSSKNPPLSSTTPSLQGK